MAGISFSGLTKVFEGGTTAVDRLDLEILDGELMVIVGPSGSGKTTVLRMTAGLEEITAGEIRIGDRVVNDVLPKDRNIAMVFQNYALYPHMRVYDNMALGLKLHGYAKGEIKTRVNQTADMLGISDLMRRKPAQLSGGQRQRVAMGRAIVREPQAFLMDEPLSNLDARLRVEMRAYLAMLHQKLHTTTLYVTHDQTEAMTLGNRVAVMRGGRLEQCDVSETLYRKPASLFVAGFIGSPAMNLIRSRLIGENGSVYAQFGETRLHLPPSLLETRRQLQRFVGEEIILGIRPEDMEDAALAAKGDPGASFDVSVSLAESMGSEVIVHFQIAAEPVEVAQGSADKAEGKTGEALAYLIGSDVAKGTTMTARLNPRTTAQTGKPVRLTVDVERLYFFDSTSETAI
ncbi:MAG: sn-glycerol-3-phosphate ABC transporter ATP-binding protein UgpC [Gaiellaceae bacterium]|jgi:multiple sugar transport system ATP-binding protein